MLPSEAVAGAGSYAVSLRAVSKRFGTHRAVEALSLEIPRGVIYGVLGPNGAGKSTTLRMVNDIIAPDAGEIRLLDGLRPGVEAAPRVGFLPEERGLYPKMKALEAVAFMGELRGLAHHDARKRARGWLERLGLSDWLLHKVQDLSKGMQQKVQFAACLVHDPELVILDEPWSGLDPVNADVLRDVVRGLAAQGCSVVLSTHLMEQAEQICDRVAIIAKGQLLTAGALSALKQAAAKVGRVALELADGVRARAEAVLADTSLAAHSAPLARGVEVELAPGVEPGRLLAALLEAGAVPRRFEEVTPTLHQIFVDLVGREAAHAERRPPAAAAAPAAEAR
jgi:ABC-2 type transport system ATP-binding protein